MAKLPLKQAPRRLCILRLSALGDVSHVVPIVRTIQRYWPETEITWIIGGFEHKLVGDLPGVRFIKYNKKGGWGAYRDIARQLAGQRFDVLLHMQVAMRANILSALIKADIRLGYDASRAKDLHGLFINSRIPDQPGQHVVDCFFSFLQTLGLDQQEKRWDIPIPDEARAFAEQHLPGDRPNLLISPCSSHALRNWRAENYAAVADHAVRCWGMRALICGGPSEGEREMGRCIENQMQEEAVNLVGKDTIKQLLAMIDRADLVISPDSGPAHMASSCNTPCIGLHAASNVWRSGPYNSRELSVDCYDEAARQHRQKPASELKWGTKLEYPGVMDLITVEQVIARLDQWAGTHLQSPN